jgi:hypothetical protein
MRFLTRELLLNACAEAGSRREPTVIVERCCYTVTPANGCLDITRSAAMLIVGSKPGGPLSRRRFDGLTQRLTSRGLCDVVTVSRTPKIDKTGLTQILAVWTSEGVRAGVLLAAAEEAALRKAGLTVALPSPGPRGSVSETEAADEDSAARDLSHLASRYPGLRLTVDQIDPTSVAAVGNALTGCHMAVLGYRRNGSTKSKAADLADGLVRQATCPLLFPVDHANGPGRAA